MIVNFGLRKSQGPVQYAPFMLPLRDAGSGAVNTVLARGTGSATFTRAGATATTVLSTGLVSSTIAANTARSYYDPTTLQYLGYLAEEARTNLYLQSNDISNVAWPGNNVTVTGNSIVGPTGATDMGFISNNAVGAGAYHYIRQTISINQSTQYTYSAFVKFKTGSGIIWILAETGANAFCYFNLNTGTVGTSTGFDRASIKAYPNGIYRISATFTKTTATAAEEIGVGVTTVDGTPNFNSTGAAGTQEVYIWGGQLEAGAFSTSYIPTAAATSTRAADSMTFPIAGNIDNASGTAFARVTLDRASNASGLSANIIGASGGLTNAIYYQTNGRPTIYDGTATADVLSTVAANTTARLSSSWGGTTLSMYLNGGSKGTAAFDGSMNFATIAIGDVAGAAGACNGCIRDVRILKRVLSDSEIASLR